MPADDFEAQRLAHQRDDDLIKQGRALERTDSRLRWLETRDREVNGQIKALTGEVRQGNAALANEIKQANTALARLETKLADQDKAEREGNERKLSKITVAGIVAGGTISAGMLITTILEIVLK